MNWGARPQDNQYGRLRMDPALIISKVAAACRIRAGRSDTSTSSCLMDPIGQRKIQESFPGKRNGLHLNTKYAVNTMQLQ